MAHNESVYVIPDTDEEVTLLNVLEAIRHRARMQIETLQEDGGTTLEIRHNGGDIPASAVLDMITDCINTLAAITTIASLMEERYCSRLEDEAVEDINDDQINEQITASMETPFMEKIKAEMVKTADDRGREVAEALTKQFTDMLKKAASN